MKRTLCGPQSMNDFVFGVLALDPKRGCDASCIKAGFPESISRWARSVRKHTVAATTDIAIFTGEGRGSIGNLPHGIHTQLELDSVLRDTRVRILHGDFADNDSRVAHSDASRFMHCVVRNRWFVIRDYLRKHGHKYRSVLMMDIRDALVQADPFAWTPHAHRDAFSLHDAIVFSGEGSGSVRTLRQSRKGVPRTLQCARDAREEQKRRLLDTDPLNAGVTLGGASAFLNFSTALSALIARVTTPRCLDVKDCTDQGLYNLLVYTHWDAYLPYTRRIILPIERAPSYTLGHRKGDLHVDADGRIRNDVGQLPPVVHQFAKGSAGKALRRDVRFTAFLSNL